MSLAEVFLRCLNLPKKALLRELAGFERKYQKWEEFKDRVVLKHRAGLLLRKKAEA